MLISIGEFTADKNVQTEDLSISGPKSYMDERYEQVMKDIADGQSAVFNMAGMRGVPTTQAILVTLQTDYAGWVGMKDFERRLR